MLATLSTWSTAVIRALLLLATVAWRWAVVIGREVGAFARARWHTLAPEAQWSVLLRSAVVLVAEDDLLFEVAIQLRGGLSRRDIAVREEIDAGHEGPF